MARFRILFISDLHFALQPRRLDLVHARSWNQKIKVLRYLFDNRRSPVFPTTYDPRIADAVARIAYAKRDSYELILLGGDLATTGLHSDLGMALRFIRAPVKNRNVY